MLCYLARSQQIFFYTYVNIISFIRSFALMDFNTVEIARMISSMSRIMETIRLLGAVEITYSYVRIMFLLLCWLTIILRQLCKNDVNNADSLSSMMSLFLKIIWRGHFIVRQYYIYRVKELYSQKYNITYMRTTYYNILLSILLYRMMTIK